MTLKKFKNKETLEKWLLDAFYQFHMHPELSFEEYETTARIRALLETAGIEILPYKLDTGLVAVVRGDRKGPVQALRADIDALPVTEETGLPYQSCVPGKMHACGHDFHITAGIGTAILLQARRSKLNGTVKFFFQPAEESSYGALKILEAGAFDDVERTWGFHAAPSFDTGVLGISPRYVAAAVDRFTITVTGTGCHGAKPHEGVDPIPAACAIVQSLQTVVSRNVNAFHPAVLSITRIEAGKTWNVIPVTAELEGTVRSMQREDRDLIERRLREIVTQTAAAYGCTAEINWPDGSPAVDNDPAMADFAARLGRQCSYEIVPEGDTMSGDDFSFYQQQKPGCYIRIGTGKGAMIHQPDFKADPTAILPTAQYLAELLCAAASHAF